MDLVKRKTANFRVTGSKKRKKKESNRTLPSNAGNYADSNIAFIQVTM